MVGQGNCSRNNEKQIEAEAELTVQELTQLLLGYHLEHFPSLAPYFTKNNPFISLMLD